MRWLRDVYGNSVAVVTFAEPARALRILSEVKVELYDDNPIACLIEPGARSFPFQYAPAEQVELIPFRLPSYPYDGPALQQWLQMGEGQHGATHAWTEIYIPGAGWRGFDPTNDKLAGTEHISVAVAREQEKASPLSGSWEGPAGAFERMDVTVQVVAQ